MVISHAHLVCESTDSQSVGYEETDAMVDRDNGLVRAHFRTIERNLHPVLDMLERDRARLRDRRASLTVIDSVRISLTVLRRWLMHSQHCIDIIRDKIVLGMEDETVDWRMVEDVHPVVSVPTTVCNRLHNVLVQLQNMPSILATHHAPDCWKTSTGCPGNIRGATLLFSRQLRTGLRSVERYLTKIRIMTLVLSDLLASQEDIGTIRR